MKRFYIFTALLVCSLMVNAQSWMGISVAPAFSFQMDNSDYTINKIGGGGMFGLSYQLQHKKFVMETGLEGAYLISRIGVNDYNLHFNMIDTKGQTFVYNGYSRKRIDASRVFNLNIPILAGAEGNDFYFLAGLKFSINIIGKTKQTAMMSTTGDYDIYYETLHDMPNHGFHDFELLETRGKTSYRFDTRIYAEFGGIIHAAGLKNRKYRIGAFFEFGLLNTMPKDNNYELFEPDLSHYMYLYMNHVHTTAMISSLHNMTFGVRFSFLFHIGGSMSAYNNIYSASFPPRSTNSSNSCNCLRF